MVAVARLVALLLAGAGPVSPPALTPIGRGPGYVLPAAGAVTQQAARARHLGCSAGDAVRVSAHLEVFARGRTVIIPPGVGMAPPVTRVGAEITSARCSYPVRTTDPTGVVEFRPGRGLTLADVFAVWGRPLSRHRVCGFRGRRPVRVYVAGRRWRGRPGAVPLTRHAEIVVEIGRRVPPHAVYWFPPAAGGAG